MQHGIIFADAKYAHVARTLLSEMMSRSRLVPIKARLPSSVSSRHTSSMPNLQAPQHRQVGRQPESTSGVPACGIWRWQWYKQGLQRAGRQLACHQLK